MLWEKGEQVEWWVKKGSSVMSAGGSDGDKMVLEEK